MTLMLAQHTSLQSGRFEMLGHSYTLEQVETRVRGFWDLSNGFPMPRNTLLCPVCRSPEVGIKHCRFFKVNHKPKTTPYRCDVSFKCFNCSAVWMHGVPVPKEAFKCLHNGGRAWTWRQMRCRLNQRHSNG